MECVFSQPHVKVLLQSKPYLFSIGALITFFYYTALLNAVECSVHLNGASQRSVVNYFSIFDRCYA